MKTYNIASIAGDGIGKEVVPEAHKVLNKIAEQHQFKLVINEFDFSSWVHDDSQEDIYQQFKYYLERGVSPEFVIETMRARSEDGWYPRRKELLKAKVITK